MLPRMERLRCAVALASLLACTRNPASTAPADGGGTGGPGGADASAGSGDPSGSIARVMYEANPGRQLDLVFLVDNSDSMAEEQEKLARAFPVLMQQLQNIPGGAPDLRIAFVSSNFGA